jgi:hypothetical protein
MYILLSGTLAVVTSSAVRGTMISPIAAVYMLDVVCVQISIPWYDYIPTLHVYRCQNEVLPLFPWMIYAIDDHLLLAEYLYTAVIDGSARPSTTNRYPIVDILCLMSVELVLNRLSNVRLHGMDIKPQAIASLLLY